MKIYTKTGDQGDTGLFGAGRVGKDSPRIEAYGTIDELNSVLGLARAEGLEPQFDRLLGEVQNDLFCVGAELTTPNPAAHSVPVIGDAQVAALEVAIDRYEERLQPLAQFILPGGSKPSALLHLARTVCRRAERRLVALIGQAEEPINPRLLVYLNRASDLFFVLARAANRAAGVDDVPWKKPL